MIIIALYGEKKKKVSYVDINIHLKKKDGNVNFVAFSS